MMKKLSKSCIYYILWWQVCLPCLSWWNVTHDVISATVGPAWITCLGTGQDRNLKYLPNRPWFPVMAACCGVVFACRRSFCRQPASRPRSRSSTLKSSSPSTPSGSVASHPGWFRSYTKCPRMLPTFYNKLMEEIFWCLLQGIRNVISA